MSSIRHESLRNGAASHRPIFGHQLPPSVYPRPVVMKPEILPPPPPKPIALPRQILQETPESPTFLILEEPADSFSRYGISEKHCSPAERFCRAEANSNTDTAAEQASLINLCLEDKEIKKASSNCSSDFYLLIGGVLARLVVNVEPNSSSAPVSTHHRLDFVRNLKGFMHTCPGLTIRNNQLFLMGRSIGFDRSNLPKNENLLPSYFCSCKDDVGSRLPLQWTIHDDSVKVSATEPYMVHYDDKVFIFGGINQSATVADDGHWGCVYDCKDQSLTYIDAPAEVLGTRTESHFIWDGKVYLFCCAPVHLSNYPKKVICSYNLTSGSCSLEPEMLEKLGNVFSRPKMVVDDDVVLIFNLVARNIEAYCLKDKKWVSGFEFDIKSASLEPEDGEFPGFWDSRFHHLFIAKLPTGGTSSGEHELFLLWQVVRSVFFGSRISVQVKKDDKSGKTEVTGKVLEKVTKLDVDPKVSQFKYRVAAVPLW